MIRLSKLTDYGFVVLSRFASDQGSEIHNARDLAEATNLPLPTVSKLLKSLSRGGLLTARRGVKGGYVLSRPPQTISASEVIAVLEGPVALTECSGDGGLDCAIEGQCPVQGHWQLISRAVRNALEQVSLADMAVAGPVITPCPSDAAVAVSPISSISACSDGCSGGSGFHACSCNGHTDREPNSGENA